MADREMMSADVWRERYSELISPAYPFYTDLVVEHADGTHLYTVDGRDVLDFGSGISVTNVGHNHPTVVQAVHEQVDRVWHTSVTALHSTMASAAESLVSVAPRGLNSVFFNNSGAEAVETAIKLARHATGRTDVIAFYGAFHGRTLGALSLTASNSKYHHKMGPFLPGVHHVHYPYCFRSCSHAPGDPCPVAHGKEIEELFRTLVHPDDVAAIVVEPIQGEGGYVVPPPYFMPTLRRICDDYGIMLVCDEVQSGFARTGKFFAVEHTDTVPDIMCVAKALANGLPMAAVVAKHDVMHSWEQGEHGSTYGGNAIACAAASAVIKTIEDEHLTERAAQLGRHVMERLRAFQTEHPQLADVRGLGLMIGLEFMVDGKPGTELVDQICAAALRRDLLLLTCGVDHNVIRLIPPLTIPEEELNEGLDRLEAAIIEVTA